VRKFGVCIDVFSLDLLYIRFVIVLRLFSGYELYLCLGLCYGCFLLLFCFIWVCCCWFVCMLFCSVAMCWFGVFLTLFVVFIG